MELEAAEALSNGLKLVGAGLAAIGMVGAGVGVGRIWASYIEAIGRNPASKDEIGAFIWIGFAVPRRSRCSPSSWRSSSSPPSRDAAAAASHATRTRHAPIRHLNVC